MFRDLTAEDIDVRVSQVGQGYAVLLLYKDARCDMTILDETVGVMSWQRRHYECKGNMYCSVGLFNIDTGEWVWKDDCGTESYTEKEKGEASDSFKRACFNWGIGRELYTAPKILINIETETNDKKKTVIKNERKIEFFVSHIKIENKKIIELEIKMRNRKDRKETAVYRYGMAKEEAGETKEPKDRMEALAEMLRKTDWTMADVTEWAKNRYKKAEISELSEKEFSVMYKTFAKTEKEKEKEQ